MFYKSQTNSSDPSTLKATFALQTSSTTIPRRRNLIPSSPSSLPLQQYLYDHPLQPNIALVLHHSPYSKCRGCTIHIHTYTHTHIHTHTYTHIHTHIHTYIPPVPKQRNRNRNPNISNPVSNSPPLPRGPFRRPPPRSRGRIA